MIIIIIIITITLPYQSCSLQVSSDPGVAEVSGKMFVRQTVVG